MSDRPTAISPAMAHDFACPVAATVDVLGGKWKALVLYHLMTGTKRFNEMRRLIPDVTQRMLTRQLRELEADGIIDRLIYREIPPKVEYSLTALGVTLVPIIVAMRDWGEQFEARMRPQQPAQCAEGERVAG